MALESYLQAQVNEVFNELCKVTGHSDWLSIVADGKKELKKWQLISSLGTKASGNYVQFESDDWQFICDIAHEMRKKNIDDATIRMTKAVLMQLKHFYLGKENVLSDLGRFFREIVDCLQFSIREKCAFYEKLATLVNPYAIDTKKEVICIGHQVPKMGPFYAVIEYVQIRTTRALSSIVKYGKNKNTACGKNPAKTIRNFDISKFHAVSCYIWDEWMNFHVNQRTSTQVFETMRKQKKCDVSQRAARSKIVT